ncbi:hypothetical protein L596_027282 [Steinernema carpocapsae]|uniref:Uncharacterized protein n=1 Tax=Steinernema carpocapsae TaxID=34508 RepID=A0A4U5M3W7_STECR|nr:hypothetical protein L596_027282 [Steinernema carpocapsae]
MAYTEVVRKQKAHAKAIVGVRFAEDPETRQHYLITVGHDALKVWVIEGFGRDHFSLDLKRELNVGRNSVQDFDASPTGRLIAVLGMDGTLFHTILGGDSLEPSTQTYNIGYMSMRFCLLYRDSYLTTAFSGALKLVGFDGEVRQTADIDPSHIKLRNVTAIALSTNGLLVVLASSEGHVCLVEMPSMKSKPNFEAHAKKIRALAFLQNDERLLTGCDDKTIRMHNIVDEKPHKKAVKTFCGHTALVTGLTVDRHSEDKRFVSCANDKRCILWDAKSGAKLNIFDAAYESVINSLSISSNGKYLAFVTEEGSIFVNEISETMEGGSGKEEQKVNESEDFDEELKMEED